MGVLTGVGGGIIRDILAREVPMILRTEIYATACIVGGIVHATAYYTFALPLENAAMLGMVVTVTARLPFLAFCRGEGISPHSLRC